MYNSRVSVGEGVGLRKDTSAGVGWQQAYREESPNSRLSIAIFCLSSAVTLLPTPVLLRAQEGREARDMLARCAKSQAVCDRARYDLTAERVHYFSKTNRETTTKTEGSCRRDGRLLKFTGLATGKATYPYVELFKDGTMVSYKPTKEGKVPKTVSLFRALSARSFAERCGELDGYNTAIAPFEKRLAEILKDCPDVRVSGTENIKGVACKIVRASTDYGEFAVWLAEELGCLPLKWQQQAGPNHKNPYDNDQTYGKTKARVTDSFLSVNRVFDEVRVEKMREGFVTTSARLTHVLRFKGFETRDVWRLSRKNVVLNPSFSEGDFSVDLPEGTPLVDNDRSGVAYEWRNGKAVPAFADFQGSAERAEAPRSILVIISWFLIGAALLAVGIRLIIRYRLGRPKT
jgi:hypothetical protein